MERRGLARDGKARGVVYRYANSKHGSGTAKNMAGVKTSKRDIVDNDGTASESKRSQANKRNTATGRVCVVTSLMPAVLVEVLLGFLDLD